MKKFKNPQSRKADKIAVRRADRPRRPAAPVGRDPSRNPYWTGKSVLTLFKP